MKKCLFAIMAVATLCTLVSAVCASDFRLVAIQTADKTRTYTVFNNSRNYDVVEWTLHWNPYDWLDDLNQGMANFDSSTGVIPPVPSMWYQVAAVFPWFATPVSQGAIKRNGGSLGGFTVRYGTPTNPNPVLPQWFTVSYYDGGTLRTSAMMPVAEEIVPEPATILVLGSGILTLAARRRRRLG